MLHISVNGFRINKYSFTFGILFFDLDALKVFLCFRLPAVFPYLGELEQEKRTKTAMKEMSSLLAIYLP